MSAAGTKLAKLALTFAMKSERPSCSRAEAQDPAMRRQVAIAMAEVQGRQQLAHGKVAGAAEQQQVE